MRLWTLIASACVLMISGCSSSVHPLLTDTNFVNKLDLNGTWTQTGLTETKLRIPRFTCVAFDDKSGYEVTLHPDHKGNPIPDRGKKMPLEYEMRIGKLGNNYYLQLSRSKQISGGPSFFEGVVNYTWAKVSLEDNVLKIYPVDDQVLEEMLPKSGLAHLMHKPSDFARNIVITESTAKLQAFLVKHQATLFSKTALTFSRKDRKATEQPGSKPPE